MQPTTSPWLLRGVVVCLVLWGTACGSGEQEPGGSGDDIGAATADAGPDGGFVAEDVAPKDVAPKDVETTAADAGPCPMDGLICDDGDPCTFGDRCVAGACAAGQDLCECRVKHDCAALEDGDGCNGTLTCDTTKPPYRCRIDPTTIVTCDGSGTLCAPVACVPAAGKCLAQPAPKGTICDDGDPCSLGDVCEAGACVGGSASVCQCEETADCAALEDGNSCNGTLYCAKSVFPHKCKVNKATIKDCAKLKVDIACHGPGCAPGTGKCKPVPLADGTSCDAGKTACASPDTCHGGVCKPAQTCTCSKDADCEAADNGNLCDGTFFCAKSTGLCAFNPASTVVCPTYADTACRTTACVPLSGACTVTLAPDGGPCDDGDAATIKDRCVAGTCKGTAAKVCAADKDCAKYDDNLCVGLHYCDKSTGIGECKRNPATAVKCPSGFDTACSKNTCKPATGKCALTAVSDGTGCDAGDACFANDFCKAGACAKGPVKKCACTTDADCPDDDGDACNGTRFCDKSTAGAFKCAHNPATKVVCKLSGDVCQPNVCDPKSGACALANAPTGTDCDDGSTCTTGDGCATGACVGKAIDCDDKDPCTFDSCVHGKGCRHVANTCDDGNSCTADRCIKSTGKCAAEPVKQGTLCNADGSGCTINDFCAAGLCKAGAPAACKLDGLGVCEQPACVGTGVTSFKCVAATRPDGSSCDDGKACRAGAACKQGQCRPGTVDRLWTRIVAPPVAAAHGDLRAVVGVGDGDVLAAGHWRPGAGGKAGTAGWWLTRLKATGEVAWNIAATAQQAPTTVTTTDIGAQALLPRPLGEALVVGADRGPSGDLQARVSSVGADGALKADAWYGSAAADEAAVAAAEASTGERYLAGWRRLKSVRAGWVLRVDGAGKELWQHVEAHGHSARFSAAVVAPGGGVFAAGTARASASAKDTAVVVHLRGADAAVRWRRVFRSAVAHRRFAAIARVGDALVVAGSSAKDSETKGTIAGLAPDGAVLFERNATALGPFTAALPRATTTTVLANVSTGGQLWLGGYDALANRHWHRGVATTDARVRSLTHLDTARLAAAGRAMHQGREAGLILRTDRFAASTCAAAGACWGKAGCADGNACTLDACAADKGCSHPIVNGLACPYNDGCVTDGACQQGACKPGPTTRVGEREYKDVGAHSYGFLRGFPDGGTAMAVRLGTGKLKVARLAADGEVLDVRTLLTNAMSDVYDVLTLPGGDLVLMGRVEKPTLRTRVMRVGPDGTIVWSTDSCTKEHYYAPYYWGCAGPATLALIDDGKRVLAFATRYSGGRRPAQSVALDVQTGKHANWKQHAHDKTIGGNFSIRAITDGEQGAMVASINASTGGDYGDRTHGYAEVQRFDRKGNRTWKRHIGPKGSNSAHFDVRHVGRAGTTSEYALLAERRAAGQRQRWELRWIDAGAMHKSPKWTGYATSAAPNDFYDPRTVRALPGGRADILGSVRPNGGLAAAFIARADRTGKLLFERRWALQSNAVHASPTNNHALLPGGRVASLHGILETGNSVRPLILTYDAWAWSSCAKAGKCGAVQPADCDDKKACTADACAPDKGCIHTAISGCGGG